MHRQYIPLSIIVCCVLALYGGFLYNPVVFDDMEFFRPGAIDIFLGNMGFYPRQLAYATLALTSKYIGTGLLAHRIQSLMLHAATSIALYYFVRQVQTALGKEESGSVLLPLLAALLFALHPMAVYGAAYLLQRTIVMATLFALMSWTFLLKGLQTGRQTWLWWSVAMYAMAVLSKEHAVATPLVCAALIMWWRQTQPSRPSGRVLLLRFRWMILASAAIAVFTVLSARGAGEVLGSAYELEAGRMLQETLPSHAWPLSAITQGFLFFKYLGLWLLPNPMWMSVDMREQFAQSLMVWPQTAGFGLFILWPLIGGWLLLKGRRAGLIGFALIAPWLLFATELSTVRVQEIFVLYRSYLWFAPAFSVLLVLSGVARDRVTAVVMVVVCLVLFAFSHNRLVTFSHPLLLWDDAARLTEGRSGLTGLDRIYRNRGHHLAAAGKPEMAIEDYTQAINARPDFYHAYNDRGAAHLALKQYPEALADFEMALKLKSDYPNSHMGRATALEALGRTDEAAREYLVACKLGWRRACQKQSS